ncbi:hypothetical protein Y717_00755 [Streptomyces scopuliridis RB72]|uniref:Uncharacterized protein n=1 Tax=Streptomyces scopuliridis RB72 TaxID=1440053 RepID=A0A2T7TGI6_9ACTN|nr:hypothetical protein Y717_00755 [Streptomyces scopuliridis RB72]
MVAGSLLAKSSESAESAKDRAPVRHQPDTASAPADR